MSRDLDISLLRAFASVVETGSVTAAARLLNRTQAAVSLQIKRLEEMFGRPLFERAHRRLVLTPVGERLVADAKRIVALNDELFGHMTTPDFAGEVRFGVPTDIVRTYIPPILRRFNQSWPRVRVTLDTGNSFHLLDRYRHGDLDVVLTTDTRRDAGAETLRIDRLVWVGAPGTQVHLEDPLPVTIGDPSCRFRPSVLDALRQAGRQWRLVLEVSNQIAQDATVSAGIAVSAALHDSVPDSLVELGVESGLPLLPEYEINMYAPNHGHNAIADELVRHIRQEFKARFGGLTAAPRAPRHSKVTPADAAA
jgi:DNA-binding transcriptional LysR family regulator